jgi:hypothetical protein
MRDQSLGAPGDCARISASPVFSTNFTYVGALTAIDWHTIDGGGGTSTSGQ